MDRTGCTAVACCLLALCTSLAPARAEPAEVPLALSGAETEKLLTGNSLAGNGKIKDPSEPFDWVAHYAADGTLRLRLKPEWGGKVMTGRWWMNDAGQQCRKFDSGHQKEGCWKFFREGPFLRFVPTSGTAVEGRAVRIEGNALQ